MALKNDFNTSVFTGQDVTLRSSEFTLDGLPLPVGDIIEASIVVTHEFPALNQWASINYPLYYTNYITSGDLAGDYFHRATTADFGNISIMKKVSFSTSESTREAHGFRCVRTIEIVASVTVTSNIAAPTVSHSGGPFEGNFTFTATKAAEATHLIVLKRDLNGITASTGGWTNYSSTSNFSNTISNECVLVVANINSGTAGHVNGKIIIFWNDT